MAWIRTAVSLISFGFTIYKFFQYVREENPGEHVRRLLGPTEYALIMIGVGVGSLFLASIQNWHLRRIMRKRYHDLPFSVASLIAGLITILGIITFIAVIYRQ